MNLFKASSQWSERPADERFWNLADLTNACRSYRASAVVKEVPYAKLTARAEGSDVTLVGPAGVPAQLTHWAFGQLCQRAQAPASYLRELPATLAAQCVNIGLAARSEDEVAALLMHPNGSLLCRAMNSPMYTRIWNDDISMRLERLAENGWRVPPARPAPLSNPATVRLATPADVLAFSKGGSGLSINVGDPIAPAGLYASDHDLFAFLINDDRLVDAGGGETLARGVMVWNSEVGATSFGVMTFLYEAVCGNHIVWGARGVSELRIRHVGNADDRAFGELTGELKRFADESVSEQEAKILSAKSFTLGANKELVLDRIFGLRIPQLSRRRVSESYEMAEVHEAIHGAPATAWGLASGMTRLSQTLPYADERVALDRAAGKVLELVF